MSKVLGIGLSRTGTASLARALAILGYRSVHFPRSVAEIDAHEAATDASVTYLYKELDRRYPGARFILTTRDREAWLASCRWHFETRAPLHAYDEETRRLAVALRTALYDGVDFEPQRFSRCYDRHLADVRDHFRDRPEDLLVLDVCADADPWPALCTFLGTPVPEVPFPRENRRGTPIGRPRPDASQPDGLMRRAARRVRRSLRGGD
jgi:hypothetical protein